MNAHLTLDGEYKVSVYNKDGTLQYSTGPHKNFITSTGLSYPVKYAFADCFRYISLGTSDAKNTINSESNGWGTVNLYNPDPNYLYIGGREQFSDPGAETSQYVSAGYRETTSGIALFRSWKIPPGDESYFSADTTYNEVMLSPGRPYVTGISSASTYNGAVTSASATTITDIYQDWTVNEFIATPHYVKLYNVTDDTYQQKLITSNTSTSLVTAGNFIISNEKYYEYYVHPTYKLCHSDETEGEVCGLDYSAIAQYYSSFTNILSQVSPICEATGAFVRIVKSLPVTKDSYMVFDYTLYVNAETGRVDFALTTINNRGVKQNANWHSHEVSGCHNLIHHGVKYINPGTVGGFAPWNGHIAQVSSYDETFEYGESFIGPWGSPLEPSTAREYLTAYLTSDNLQFYANAKDGGKYVAGVPGLNSQSGLMLWRSTPLGDVTVDFDTRWYNIRKPANVDNTSSTPYWPKPTDLTDETADSNEIHHGVFYLKTRTDPAITHSSFADPKTRSRSISRSFEFATIVDGASDFIYQPVRGIVLSYSDVGGYADYHIPYLDCLFTSSGVLAPNPPAIIPKTTYPVSKTYDTGTSVYGYWYYLEHASEDSTKLTLSFTETWSSPCNPTVDGC